MPRALVQSHGLCRKSMVFRPGITARSCCSFNFFGHTGLRNGSTGGDFAHKGVLQAPRTSLINSLGTRFLAITPHGETEFDNLDLYHATDGGADALARKRREDAIRERARPGVQQLIGAHVVK